MMDEYGNALTETQIALHAQRITAVEASHADIMAELKEIRRELSGACGGVTIAPVSTLRHKISKGNQSWQQQQV